MHTPSHAPCNTHTHSHAHMQRARKRTCTYTLKDVHDKVKCHVLVFLGENDIYVKDPRQYAIMKNAFKNAASYTFKVFKEEYGSAEHCQIGAVEQKVQLVTNWLKTIPIDEKECP